MKYIIRVISLFSILFTLLSLNACSESDNSPTQQTPIDPKLLIVEDNILKYAPAKSASAYKLTQLSDSAFNNLTSKQKYKVADKLLSSLFFAYSYEELKQRIESHTFLSDVQQELLESHNNMGYLESEIHNSEHYYISDSKPQNVILSRFAAMKNLDNAYFNHWISYILTQTILFSPAAELGTVAAPDAYAVYNRLYYALDDDFSMRYSSFSHMISDENWRRFRSPEDNGREMLEIYALDGNDANVPIAAQALKNWHLSKDADTLLVTQDRNTEELSILQDMKFKNGREFYAALCNAPEFTEGVTSRLVDFMFTDNNEEEKASVVKKIVSSKPEAWPDILKQILFSKEYLLNAKRAKSIEELVFPLMKKLSYNSYYYTFNTLTDQMDNMSQPAMKYKLGKLTRVPLDDISFAFYQSYIRDEIFRPYSIDTALSNHPNYEKTDDKNSASIMDNYKNYKRRGASSKIFMSEDRYEVVETDISITNTNYVKYLFESILNRTPSVEENTMIMNHIANSYYKNYLLANTGVYDQDVADYNRYTRYQGRYLINYLVFEYMLRLDELYFFGEVE